jgi:hypothetical protein
MTTVGSSTLEEAATAAVQAKRDAPPKSAPPKISAAVEEEIQEIFEDIDTNHDGKLEAKEIQVSISRIAADLLWKIVQAVIWPKPLQISSQIQKVV